MRRIPELFSTFFYLGKSKYCPGTFGSLAAFPLCYFWIEFILWKGFSFSFGESFSEYENLLLSVFFFLLLLSAALFWIGVYFSSLHSKNIGSDDPAEIVIDEVAGQSLAIALCYFSKVIWVNSILPEKFGFIFCAFLFSFLSPFALFRLFDILKPWPVNWLDRNIKGGLGIMLDDAAAAALASLSHYVLIFVAIDIAYAV